MKSVEVTARFNTKGEVFPKNFSFQNRNYRIVSTGRTWIKEDNLHFLVMTPSEQIFELIFVPKEILWYIQLRNPSNQKI
jgi:hypothetical protein